MRFALALCFVLASTAFADVPTPCPKARCSVPSGCLVCWAQSWKPDSGTDCRAAAADAGLVLSECTDRAGSGTNEYYCPPGHPAVSGCGCAAIDGFALAAALTLVPWLRRRR